MMSKSLERIRNRATGNQTMTPISIRLPDNMLKELKEISEAKGFSGYQGLIRFYISKGMRADLEELDRPKINAIVKSLEQDGVTVEIIQKALASA